MLHSVDPEFLMLRWAIRQKNTPAAQVKQPKLCQSFEQLRCVSASAPKPYVPAQVIILEDAEVNIHINATMVPQI